MFRSWETESASAGSLCSLPIHSRPRGSLLRKFGQLIRRGDTRGNYSDTSFEVRGTVHNKRGRCGKGQKRFTRLYYEDREQQQPQQTDCYTPRAAKLEKFNRRPHEILCAELPSCFCPRPSLTRSLFQFLRGFRLPVVVRSLEYGEHSRIAGFARSSEKYVTRR